MCSIFKALLCHAQNEINVEVEIKFILKSHFA